MQITMIERDIINRENALRRCKYNVICLQTSPRASEYAEGIKMLSQEAFYLQDQLDRFYILLDILKEEQGACDEMLPRV
jgi:hypothetical protein